LNIIKLKLDLNKTKSLLQNNSPYIYPVTPEFNEENNWHEYDDECNVPLSDDTAISTRELKKSSTLVFNLPSQESNAKIKRLDIIDENKDLHQKIILSHNCENPKIETPLNINDEDYSTAVHKNYSPRKTYILNFRFTPNNDLISLENIIIILTNSMI
jgi:hypothetical protein